MGERFKNFIYKNYLLITIILYSLIFFILLPFFLRFSNPDGINLINIAKKYLSGNFRLAINGYWSPLISILGIPFLIIFKDGFLAFKILSFFIGLFSIFSFDRFLKKLNIESKYSKLLFILILPIVSAEFSLVKITSDFLVTVFFILLLSFFVDEEFFNKKYSFLILGFIGFLTYLSKTYGFFFFLGFLLFFFLLYLVKKDFVKLKNIIFTGLFFIFLSSFWIILISSKYGYFTIGTTGKYNYNCHFTVDTLNVKKVYSRPLPTPDSLSTWYFDDPSFIHLPDVTFKMIKENSGYYVRRIFIGTLVTLRSILSFTIFLPLIIIFSIPLFFKKEKRLKLLIILIASFFSFIGYLPIYCERRYIIINFYLISSLFLIVFDYLKYNDNIKKLIFIFVLLSFLLNPSYDFSKYFYLQKYKYNFFYNFYLNLKGLNLSGNIVANKPNTALMQYCSYYLNLRYYWVLRCQKDKKEFFDDLKKYNISYYFYYGNGHSCFDSTQLVYETFLDYKDFNESLKIYKVDK